MLFWKRTSQAELMILVPLMRIRCQFFLLWELYNVRGFLFFHSMFSLLFYSSVSRVVGFPAKAINHQASTFVFLPIWKESRATQHLYASKKVCIQKHQCMSIVKHQKRRVPKKKNQRYFMFQNVCAQCHVNVTSTH